MDLHHQPQAWMEDDDSVSVSVSVLLACCAVVVAAVGTEPKEPWSKANSSCRMTYFARSCCCGIITITIIIKKERTPVKATGKNHRLFQCQSP
mmetsp:Transcript_32056/g.77891  ORF Transcript_32056/g.77891 Transcript_32056/m.77891 type:complete len:93 (-) Transcript_32056:571-849(-)